jgi:hypothetical protein
MPSPLEGEKPSAQECRAERNIIGRAEASQPRRVAARRIVVDEPRSYLLPGLVLAVSSLAGEDGFSG